MTLQSLLGKINNIWKVISGEKAYPFLGLLLVELIMIGIFSGDVGLFWLFMIIYFISLIFLVFYFFDINPKEIKSHKNTGDALFSLGLGIFFAPNLIIFNNPFSLVVASLVFVFGFSYLLFVLKAKSNNQIQRNSLLLAALFLIFFATNFFINITFIIQGESFSFFSRIALLLFVFPIVYFSSYYLFRKYKTTIVWSKNYSLILALILSEALIVGSYYFQKYPNFYSMHSQYAIALISLVMIVLFYAFFGLIANHLKEKLNTKIVIEYIGITTIILVTLFVTTEWF